MKRFEYAQIVLATRSNPRRTWWSTEASWFTGLDDDTVAAIRATAGESTAERSTFSGGVTEPYHRLFTIDVLNVVGARGWRAYRYERVTYAESPQEIIDLVRELD